MIHFVSGYRRSGTSMMMDCLGRGGMPLLFDPDQDKLIEERKEDGYLINKSLFEIDPHEFNDEGFRNRVGGVVKIIAPGCTAHAREGDRCVFMMRDFREIQDSHERSLLDTVMYTQGQFEDMIASTVAHLKRIGVDVVTFWYRAVVDSPAYHFKVLEASGWPIDADRAIEGVDPAMCRFKAA